MERKADRERQKNGERQRTDTAKDRQTNKTENGERQRTDTAMNKVESKLDLSAEKGGRWHFKNGASGAVSYTHLRAHET